MDWRIRAESGIEPPGLVRAVIETGIESAFAIFGGQVFNRAIQIRGGSSGLRSDGDNGYWADDEIIAIHKLADRDRGAEGPSDAVFGDGTCGGQRC